MKENNIFSLLKEQEFLIKLTEGADSCMASPTALRIHGHLDFEKLESAIRSVVKRNDVLRTVLFQDESGQTKQRLLDDIDYKLDVRSVQGITLEERVRAAVTESQIIMAERNKIDNGEVAWDFVLFDLGDNEYILFNRVSHILCDGVGNNIILAEIDAYYRGISLPEKTVGFFDYYREKQVPEYVDMMEAQIENWKEESRDYKEVIKIPPAGKKPTALTPFTVLPATELRKFSRLQKDSLFKVNMFLIHISLMAAFEASDSIINCMDGSRERKFSQTVGFLTNGYLSRATIPEEVYIKDAFVSFSKNHTKNSRDARISFLLDEPYPVYVTYQNHYSFGNVNFCNAIGEPIPEIAELNSWNLLVFCVFESVENIVFLTGCDYDTFTPDIMGRVEKGLKLGIKCLTEKDMTFGEFTKIING